MIMEKRKEIGRWYTKDKEGEKFCNGSKRWKKLERELKKKKKKKKGNLGMKFETMSEWE